MDPFDEVQETDLFDDEILLRGRRWGGLSEFQEKRRGGAAWNLHHGWSRTLDISDVWFHFPNISESPSSSMSGCQTWRVPGRSRSRHIHGLMRLKTTLASM